jgi:hypothetical protein
MSATNWPIVPAPDDSCECGVVGGRRIGRGNRSTRRKPAPAPHCPPQIPYHLTWDRIRAAAVGSQPELWQSPGRVISVIEDRPNRQLPRPFALLFRIKRYENYSKPHKILKYIRAHTTQPLLFLHFPRYPFSRRRFYLGPFGRISFFTGSGAPLGPGFCFHFLDYFTDCRTPWTSGQLAARPLPKHRTTHTHTKHPCFV